VLAERLSASPDAVVLLLDVVAFGARRIVVMDVLENGVPRLSLHGIVNSLGCTNE
jgi:hypothetical protein